MKFLREGVNPKPFRFQTVRTTTLQNNVPTDVFGTQAKKINALQVRDKCSDRVDQVSPSIFGCGVIAAAPPKVMHSYGPGTAADIPTSTVVYGHAVMTSSRDSTGASGEVRAQRATVTFLEPRASRKEMQEINDLTSWYYDRGDFQEARRLYEFLVRDPSQINEQAFHTVSLRMAQTSWINGSYESAEMELRDLFYSQAIISYSAQDSTWTYDTGRWLALTQWKRGDYTNAETTINVCLDRIQGKTKPPTLLSTLALVLASRGAFKRAWKLSKSAAEEAERISANNPEAQADYRFCLLNHARVSSELGRFREATAKCEEALHEIKKWLGPRHFFTLDAASLRAWLLVVDNDTMQVEEEIQRTLRQMRERLGENHPSTLQAVQTLVLMYKGDGRYTDAEATARYLVQRCEKHPELKSNHPQTLKSKAILAEVLLAMGNWTRAEDIQSEVVHIEKDNFLFQTMLADILRVRGDWNLARVLAADVLFSEIEKFSGDEEGDDNFDVYEGHQIDYTRLETILRMSKHIDDRIPKANNYDELSRPLKSVWIDANQEAYRSPFASKKPVRVYPSLIRTLHCLALCEQVRDDANLAFVHEVLNLLIEILIDRLGSGHRLIINLKHDLGVNHRLRGNFSTSLKQLTSVVNERRKSLGVDHSDYLITRHQRAVSLSRMNRCQEALQEQTVVMGAQANLLGRSHVDTITSRYTLAGIHHSFNRLDEAEAIIKDALDCHIQLYKAKTRGIDDHPIVLRTRARYALILLDHGKLEAAELEQQHVYEQRMRILPEGHTLTRSAKNDLAQIKQVQGHYGDAERLYVELQNNSQRPNSPMEYHVQSNLASCYFETGRFRQAEVKQIKLYMESKQSTSKGRPNTRLITTAFNLALTCKALCNRRKEAYCLLSEALSTAESVLGDTHPQTDELRATQRTWKEELHISNVDTSIHENDSSCLTAYLEEHKQTGNQRTKVGMLSPNLVALNLPPN